MYPVKDGRGSMSEIERENSKENEYDGKFTIARFNPVRAYY